MKDTTLDGHRENISQANGRSYGKDPADTMNRKEDCEVKVLNCLLYS